MLTAHNLNVKLLTHEASVHYWECGEDEDVPPAMMLDAVWIPLVLNLHHTAQLQLLPKLIPADCHLQLHECKFLQQSQAISTTAERI
jgi:hypothetical protein